MLTAILLAAALTNTPIAKITSVGYDMPKKTDKNTRYVFYLHGRVIEARGLHPNDERYGTYEYLDILKALRSRGVYVISEARPNETNAHHYAERIANQIRELRKRGVPANHITVIGASKGAVITMLVSTLVADRDVRFVLMANCNDSILDRFKPNLHGAVLSIYDEKDVFGGTCEPFFAKATGLSRQHEIKTTLGIGHALLYAPYPEWVEPAIAWAKEN